MIQIIDHEKRSRLNLGPYEFYTLHLMWTMYLEAQHNPARLLEDYAGLSPDKVKALLAKPGISRYFRDGDFTQAWRSEFARDTWMQDADQHYDAAWKICTDKLSESPEIVRYIKEMARVKIDDKALLEQLMKWLRRNATNANVIYDPSRSLTSGPSNFISWLQNAKRYDDMPEEEKKVTYKRPT